MTIRLPLFLLAFFCYPSERIVNGYQRTRYTQREAIEVTLDENAVSGGYSNKLGSILTTRIRKKRRYLKSSKELDTLVATEPSLNEIDIEELCYGFVIDDSFTGQGKGTKNKSTKNSKGEESITEGTDLFGDIGGKGSSKSSSQNNEIDNNVNEDFVGSTIEKDTTKSSKGKNSETATEEAVIDVSKIDKSKKVTTVTDGNVNEAFSGGVSKGSTGSSKGSTADVNIETSQLPISSKGNSKDTISGSQNIGDSTIDNFISKGSSKSTTETEIVQDSVSGISKSTEEKSSKGINEEVAFDSTTTQGSSKSVSKSESSIISTDKESSTGSSKGSSSISVVSESLPVSKGSSKKTSLETEIDIVSTNDSNGSGKTVSSDIVSGGSLKGKSSKTDIGEDLVDIASQFANTPSKSPSFTIEGSSKVSSSISVVSESLPVSKGSSKETSLVTEIDILSTFDSSGSVKTVSSDIVSGGSLKGKSSKTDISEDVVDVANLFASNTPSKSPSFTIDGSSKGSSSISVISESLPVSKGSSKKTSLETEIDIVSTNDSNGNGKIVSSDIVSGDSQKGKSSKTDIGEDIVDVANLFASNTPSRSPSFTIGSVKVSGDSNTVTEDFLGDISSVTDKTKKKDKGSRRRALRSRRRLPKGGKGGNKGGSVNLELFDEATLIQLRNQYCSVGNTISAPSLVPNLIAPTTETEGGPTSSLQQPLCSDAFVYCPGRSECVVDPLFNEGVPVTGNGSWGFNIFFDADKEHSIDNCDIIMGVKGCDVQTGVKVGTVTITKDIVHFCLDINNYESNSFQLYAGKCVASDTGLHLTNGGKCDKTKIAQNGILVSQYPMISSGGPFKSTHTFDRSDPTNTIGWSTYTTFPIGIEERNYLIGHVEVCPIMPLQAPPVAPTIVPPLSPTTQLPTILPSKTPTKIPTSNPSQYPIAYPSLKPTSLPTRLPSFGPAMEPSLSPTQIPTSNPTSLPTKLPSIVATPSPTKSSLDSAELFPPPPECFTGFVYCPGRSICLSDLFDVTSPGLWGWSIDYDAKDGTVDDCDIYIGGSYGCDMTNATKVGSFLISPKFVHYSLDLDSYTSRSFNFYAGKCPANDNANHLFNGDVCDEQDMIDSGNRYDKFPLIANSNQSYVDTFVFDKTDKSSGAWTSQYNVFDIGTKYRKFLTAHVDVCPLSGILTAPAIPVALTPVIAPVSAPILALPIPTPLMVTSATPSQSTFVEKATVASINPTVTKSSVPSTSPTKEPTNLPSIMTSAPLIPSAKPSVKEASGVPSSVPTGLFVNPGMMCVPAYVYCPGRSQCFNDILFKNVTVWGWNIFYNSSSGVVDDCEIVTGFDGCNPANQTKVGSFKITPTSVTYQLDKGVYAATDYAFYAGQCRANDAGVVRVNGGFCDNSEICRYAADPTTYPLALINGELVDEVTFDRTSPVNPGNYTGYEVFPVGVNFRTWLSASVEVCKF